MMNTEKTFRQLGIIVLSLSALGMLGHAYGLLAVLFYKAPFFSEIQTFPLNETTLHSLMAKGRFYFALQLIAHGLLFAAAFRLMEVRGSGRWLLNAGAALLLILVILLPLSFPGVQMTDNPEGISAYRQVRSQLVIMSVLWLFLWAAVVYYVNRQLANNDSSSAPQS